MCDSFGQRNAFLQQCYCLCAFLRCHQLLVLLQWDTQHLRPELSRLSTMMQGKRKDKMESIFQKWLASQEWFAAYPSPTRLEHDCTRPTFVKKCSFLVVFQNFLSKSAQDGVQTNFFSLTDVLVLLIQATAAETWVRKFLSDSAALGSRISYSNDLSTSVGCTHTWLELA